MSTKTKIEWTDSTWSPIRARVKRNAAEIAARKGYSSLVEIAALMHGKAGPHCEHVSPGCEHCYAETNNHRRLPGNGTGLPYDRRARDLVESYVDEAALLAPLKWGRVVETEPRPRRIFVENQSDLFGEWVSDEMVDQVFAVMALCPGHIFQVLTKRPERMLEYFTKFLHLSVREAFISQPAQKIDLARKGSPVLAWSGLPMPNVWLGVSAENQAMADLRIPLLLKTPAAARFISAEPLLGRIDADTWLGLGLIDWVIAGGESGPGARPMHPLWAQMLRDQCRNAGVPFFFKQWGAWRPAKDGRAIVARDGHIRPKHEALTAADCRMRRDVRDKTALLDGREWKEFPCFPQNPA